MILGYFGSVYLTWIYIAWLPGYLEIERHMSVKCTGHRRGDPVRLRRRRRRLRRLVRRLADAPRHRRRCNSRKVPAAVALLGTALCTRRRGFVASNTLAIVFISASLFLVYVTSTCAWALSSVAAPTNCTASLGAVQNFGGYLGGALAPTVTGLIVQATGSFVLALVVGAAIGVASAVSYCSSSTSRSPRRRSTRCRARKPGRCQRVCEPCSRARDVAAVR